ncbi:MAG: helix-turn-helix domain-containing protein [Ruminococcaceae bacterium]|nr:helix-turn-helix domain-containing protein [Oscillospiraceae bacterium]
MRQNETLIHYAGSDRNSRYTVRLYESSVDFTHRDFFYHKHSDFEFSYIVSGNGLYALRDGACMIKEGDVFLFGANQVHCITDRDPETPMLLFNLQFESRLIWSPLSDMLNERYLQFFNGKCERLDPFADSTARIARIMKQIMQENQAKNVGYQLMIKAYLYQIIGELIRGCGVSFEEPADGARQRSLFGMDQAMTYINGHLDAPLSLEEIASVAGFTRTYFSTLFTELNGLTTWDYITIRRIERSCELLRKTDLPIIEVAQRCGYENLSNFNRMFLRIVGTSPSVYRRTHFLKEIVT